MTQDDLDATTESGEDAAAEAGMMIDELARLPERTIINQGQLARILGFNPRTIHRLVDRGELPPGVPLGNNEVWLAGRILDHLTARVDAKAREAEKRQAKISRIGT